MTVANKTMRVVAILKVPPLITDQPMTDQSMYHLADSRILSEIDGDVRAPLIMVMDNSVDVNVSVWFVLAMYLCNEWTVKINKRIVSFLEQEAAEDKIKNKLNAVHVMYLCIYLYFVLIVFK